jgi:hypothetical protein
LVQIAYARRPLARRSTRAGLTPLTPHQFEGYASLWDVADGAGDRVAPGAFAQSLRRRGPGQVRMLYQNLMASALCLGALCACSTPPPAAPAWVTLPPVSPPASLMTPPREYHCLVLSPCRPKTLASPARMLNS